MYGASAKSPNRNKQFDLQSIELGPGLVHGSDGTARAAMWNRPELENVEELFLGSGFQDRRMI